MLKACVSNRNIFIAYGYSDKINIPFANTNICVCRHAHVYNIVHVGGESRLKSYENEVSQNAEDGCAWRVDDWTINHPDQDPNHGWRSVRHIHRLEFRERGREPEQTPDNSIKSAVSEVRVDDIATLGS